jgi:hypothetical protein
LPEGLGTSENVEADIVAGYSGQSQCVHLHNPSNWLSFIGSSQYGQFMLPPFDLHPESGGDSDGYHSQNDNSDQGGEGEDEG